MGPLEEDKEPCSVNVNYRGTFLGNRRVALASFSTENHPVSALPVLCIRFHPGQQVATTEMRTEMLVFIECSAQGKNNLVISTMLSSHSWSAAIGEGQSCIRMQKTCQSHACIIPLHIMAPFTCDFGSVSLGRQSNKKGKLKKTDGQKVALYMGIMKWIWNCYSSFGEVLAFDMRSEKVMALGFYFKSVYIRYIPTQQYFLVPKDSII